MTNSKISFAKTIESLQIKVSEYALEEAKAKAEKAQIELETAKMQREYVQKALLANAPTGSSYSF